VGGAVLLGQHGPPRAGGARRLGSRGAGAPHAQSKLMGRTAGTGCGGAGPSRVGQAGAVGRVAGGDPMHCRACAMGHAYAVHVPFRARGAAGGGGGEHLVEFVLRLERRGTCVRACVRARRICICTCIWSYPMSRHLQRRGRAHDLGSDRRRSEPCRLPRRAGVPGGAGCGGAGVRGAGVRGGGVGEGEGCGRGCVRVCE
jgi:hypothetical protein